MFQDEITLSTSRESHKPGLGWLRVDFLRNGFIIVLSIGEYTELIL